LKWFGIDLFDKFRVNQKKFKNQPQRSFNQPKHGTLDFSISLMKIKYPFLLFNLIGAEESMSTKYAIALDVGGTSIKSAIVAENGTVVAESVRQTPVNSKGSYNEIISTFIEPLAFSFDYAEKNGLSIVGIGLGIPGPFDFVKGVSLIQGVDKYEAIFGVNLRETFRERLHLPGKFPIYFEMDAWTFVRGEAWLGAGKGFHRIIGITLGTGMGSGFIVGEEIVTDGPGVPPIGWIGGLPFGNGILDDRISRRGIIQRYLEMCHPAENKIDVKDIAERAQAGDPCAIHTFQETGKIIGEKTSPLAQAFGAECVIIGGQISKSCQLFMPAIEEQFAANQVTARLVPAADIAHSAILGASRFLFRKIAAE
jgi:glucokinase